MNSEITEILKLEKKFTEEPDASRQIGLLVQLINKYIRAIHFVAQRDTENLGQDERLKEAKRLSSAFQGVELDDVQSAPDQLEGGPVVVIKIGTEGVGTTIVPETFFAVAYQEANINAKLRLMLKLSKIAQRLSELLAPEIDLHKDLAHNATSVDILKRMAADRRRSNGE